ncbi:hypothetical protein SY83_18730 [Paenibacillus swuensis]|uniref:Uncharacterized protein n=1 Tax=Paenibacillus swuensis TaxID=1178515 RepID=A0A172TLT7_9BACL|nr:hypothetical protein [Paenibacillus swuensis]ANE47990.1 hypothetical protein SY83_18730 [Paenibacillus swuensis]
MKSGGFLIGAAVGAAATVYFLNNKQVVYSSANSFGHSVGNVMHDAKDKVMDAAMSSQFGMGMGAGNNSHNHAGGLDRVEAIVNNEPHLQKEVDEIMEEDRYQA